MFIKRFIKHLIKKMHNNKMKNNIIYVDNSLLWKNLDYKLVNYFISLP